MVKDSTINGTQKLSEDDEKEDSSVRKPFSLQIHQRLFFPEKSMTYALLEMRGSQLKRPVKKAFIIYIRCHRRGFPFQKI